MNYKWQAKSYDYKAQTEYFNSPKEAQAAFFAEFPKKRKCRITSYIETASPCPDEQGQNWLTFVYGMPVFDNVTKATDLKGPMEVYDAVGNG